MEAGLIRQERQGTTLVCHAVYPAMQSLVGYLVDECCQDAKCNTPKVKVEGRAA
ncbi:hypothetical protein [Dongia sp.]|jgi:ArsR family transcriptional regulator|uniref:hypothetical protein n=1 Tax=Dongia sp. TaxID=1977262 RepID=UPI0034A1AE56